MRLTEEERQIIRRVVERFVKNAELYLFGSRARDETRGGDIDLLVLGDEQVSMADILRMKIDLKDRLGDQRIDLIYQRKSALTPFAELARLEGILIS